MEGRCTELILYQLISVFIVLLITLGTDGEADLEITTSNVPGERKNKFEWLYAIIFHKRYSNKIYIAEEAGNAVSVLLAGLCLSQHANWLNRNVWNSVSTSAVFCGLIREIRFTRECQSSVRGLVRTRAQPWEPSPISARLYESVSCVVPCLLLFYTSYFGCSSLIPGAFDSQRLINL